VDVSVSTEEPTPPGVADASFAAGAATVIATDARETAENAAEAAIGAAQAAARAADTAERVEGRAVDAQITAEAVDARLGDFVEEFRDFRDDMIEIMNDHAAAAGPADLGLPPLDEGNGEEDQADKHTPPAKPKRKHYLDSWFGGR
jgi:hypothetical protein